ncbi:LAMI_0G08416g1_1 [Lachancea mirantina]|uniref:Enhancer of polycomb-like protein n=1 Tax=Lachancea mirantina TaxID=1230905 RepID=A0A1G4K9W5_9SACH|nr:LAMI_0G08416g1_1 [Lachancea mirantina]
MPTPSSSAAEAAGSRFRQRKISVKQRLQIFKASDLKDLDKDELQQREIVEIETGVEKHEEKEEHLHKILQKNQLSANDLFIPTPDASRTWSEFNEFYKGQFVEPTAYIQFSATVEDCCGASYNMDEKDEEFLRAEVNKQLPDASKVNEDEFEVICSSFEAAIQERQPFLRIDPENILSFDEVKPTILKRGQGDIDLKSSLAAEIGLKAGSRFVTQFDSRNLGETRPLSVLVEKFGSRIYEYWKNRKVGAKGGDIVPQLKFERAGDKDDSDPYICFRHREVRQPRKTRRVDYQNSHKIRLLHQQLRYTKELAMLVAKRENLAMGMINEEKTIFELRSQIKPFKLSLNIKGEDEDLFAPRKLRQISSVITETAAESNSKKLKSKHKRNGSAMSPAKLTSGRSSTKLSKQQQQQIQQQQKQQQQQQQQQERQQQQQQQQQLQAQKQNGGLAAAHVYVKLPTSKIPDVVLEDVDNILLNKEKSARKYVADKMRKRKLEDGDTFFNLTDDPYNPVFDISVPADIDPSNAPFSSIVSSKFELQNSYYMPDLQKYITGNNHDITVWNRDGELQDNLKLKKIELYNPFKKNAEIYSHELPLRLRRRKGRFNTEYVDRRISQPGINPLAEFTDFAEIEKQEDSNEVIDVYDSKLDEFSRLHDRWKYGSEQNLYGAKFSDEPAKLNQISNATQIIRFGTMLGTKSYEQLRDATIKHRQEFYNQRRNQRLVSTQKSNHAIPSPSKSMTPTPPRSSTSSSLKKIANQKQQQTTSAS